MKRLKFSIYLALALSLFAGFAQGASLTFGVSSGDWLTPSNWQGGALPTAFDFAFIINDRIANVTSAGAVASFLPIGGLSGNTGGSVFVSGAGTLTIGASGISIRNTGTFQVDTGGTVSTAGGLSLGTGNTGTTSTLIVKDAGSTLTTGGTASFGSAAGNQTNVSILNGGKMTVNGGSITLGSTTGASAQMTVSGTGSKVDGNASLTVGSQSSGSLTISSGGNIGSNTASIGISATGSALLTDTGSSWTIASSLAIGTQTASSVGSFTVQNGATGSSGALFVGINVGSARGDMTITGAGTSWMNAGDLQIRTSNGGSTVTVSAGASLTTSTTSGAVSIGTKGVLTVTGTGSTLTTTRNLLLGEGGKFLVQNGATATTTGGLGQFSPGLAGQVDVSGGAQLTTGSFTLASNSVGSPSAMTIGSGGTVTSTFFAIGNNFNADSSTLTISGTGSSLASTSTGTGFTTEDRIGAFSFGSITVDSGASLSTPGLAYVGAGASGMVTITGPNSTWTASTLRIGENLSGVAVTGTIKVLAGGKITSTSTSLGYSASNGQSQALVTVDGIGSQWTTGSLAVGDSGVASLTIRNGGVVTSTSADVGAAGMLSNASGTVLVTGAGSQWNVAGPINMNSALNTLTVEDGATVSVGGGTGTLTSNFTFSTPKNVINIGTGGLAGHLLAGTVSNGGVLNFNFTDDLVFSAAITSAGTVTKAGPGMLTLTGNNSFSGLTATGGTVRVTNPNGLGLTPLFFSNTRLILANDTGSLFGSTSTFNTALNLSTDTTITSDRVTPGPGVTHSLLQLNMNAGASKLTVDAGSNVTSGVAGLSTRASFFGDATFDVHAGASLAFSQYSDNGGNRTFVKTGPGTLILGFDQDSGPANTFIVNEGMLLEQTELTNGAAYNLVLNATKPGDTVLYQLDFINHPVTNLIFGGAGATSTSRGMVDTADSTLLIYGGVTYDATNNPLGGTITGNMAFSFGGPVIVGDSSNADSDLTIAANILAGGFTKSGPGTLTLSGDNLFAANITVAEGLVVATGKANATGGGNFTFNGGTLRLAYDTPIVAAGGFALTTSGAITLDRVTPGPGMTNTYDDVFFRSSGQTLTLTRGANVTSGTEGLSVDRLFVYGSGTVDVGAGTSLSINLLSNNNGTTFTSGSLTKTGLGTLLVKQVHDGFYIGPTNIQAGKFIVAGALTGSVSIAPGAIMTTLHTPAGGTDALTVHSDALSGGILAPGDTGGLGANSIGKLNVTGSLTLGDTGTAEPAHLQLELGGLTPGSLYDQVSLTGTLNLTNVRLELSLANGFSPGIGQQFFLITGSPNAVSGLFANQFPPDANSLGFSSFFIGFQEYALSYQANASLGTMTGGHDVAVLVVVPEASSALLLLAGSLFLGARRRPRKSGRNL